MSAFSRIWLASALAVILAAGCSPYKKEPEFQSNLAMSANVRPEPYSGPDQWPPFSALYTQRFVWKMQYVVETLSANMEGWNPAETSVLMTTIVPVEDIYRPTPFGRLVTEQLITELTKRGFGVIEARKMEGYLLRDHEGEFYLSRDLKRVAGERKANAALVGTYARSGDQVLVNVRLVDTGDARVVAAASAMMNLRGDKFLSRVFENDGRQAPEEEPSPKIGVRKKILPAMDHYSETLREMVRGMALKVAESSPPAKDDKTSSIAVATFVDVDNMRRAATFGRYMTEQLIEELGAMGYKVMELRAAPEVYTDIRIGELALTREMSRILNKEKTDALVVGTYTRADEKVLVNARMIVPATREVLGVGSMVVDAGEENKFVASLLENEVTTVMPAETVEGF